MEYLMENLILDNTLTRYRQSLHRRNQPDTGTPHQDREEHRLPREMDFLFYMDYPFYNRIHFDLWYPRDNRNLVLDRTRPGGYSWADFPRPYNIYQNDIL